MYSGALIGLDQLTKYLVTANLFQGESLTLAPFLNLVYVVNTGVAFSMFRGFSGSNTVFTLFSFTAVSVALLWYLKNRRRVPQYLKLPLLLVFSGAVGNLIDRIARGGVVDFIDFSIGSYHWPAFNVADSCITIGAVLLIIDFMISGKPKNEAR